LIASNKFIYFLFIIFACVVIIGINILNNVNNSLLNLKIDGSKLKDEKIDHYELLPDYEQKILWDGDLIFRRGTSLTSYFVLNFDRQSRFSHVGIVCHKDGRMVVVHAAPSDETYNPVVRAEPLSNFTSNFYASEVSIMRFVIPERREFSRQVAKNAADFALSAAAAKVPFDNDFDLADSSRLYCTELIRDAYRAAGANVFEGGGGQVLKSQGKPLFVAKFIDQQQLLRTNIFFFSPLRKQWFASMIVGYSNSS